MPIYDHSGPLQLSSDERKVLELWRNGDSMTKAYKKVMMTPYEIESISRDALNKRVSRFFDTFRMRSAMAATPGKRGEQARKDFEKWKMVKDKLQEREEDYKQRRKEAKDNQEFFADLEDNPENTFAVIAEKTEKKSSREKWLDSLKVNEDPTAMTIYGTGQFLAYVAVKEILARQEEIKKKKISVLATDGTGSALTPTVISALKTAASMILPFAPAPTAKDRREMSKAAILLGLVPDKIKESPDDYTAPIPATVEIEVEPETEEPETEEDDDEL